MAALSLMRSDKGWSVDSGVLLRCQCQLLLILTLGDGQPVLLWLPDQAECRHAQKKHPQHLQ
jgi:hypothetical protein